MNTLTLKQRFRNGQKNLLRIGRYAMSKLYCFICFEKKTMTDDVNMMSFELSRLFPVAVCCLVFGWIVGGACSEDTMTINAENRWAIMPFGVLMCWIVIRGMLHFVRPKRQPWLLWILVALFTAIVGVYFLMFFQYCIASRKLMSGFSGLRPRGSSVFTIKYVIIFIGWCYGQVTNPNASILAQFAGYIGGVGFCEEAVKLFPVCYIVFYEDFGIKLSFRSVLMIGLFSGLGFGIAEALSEAYALGDLSHPDWEMRQNLGVQIIRWFSCVPSHAIYSMIDTAFLWMFYERIQSAPNAITKFGWFSICVAAVAVLHGAYDVLCKTPFLGMLLDAASLLLLWVVVQIAVYVRNPELGNGTTFDFEPRTVRTFGKSFAKTYIVIALGLIIWSSILLD